MAFRVKHTHKEKHLGTSASKEMDLHVLRPIPPNKYNWENKTKQNKKNLDLVNKILKSGERKADREGPQDPWNDTIVIS